jgi:hypothetical protein
MAANADDAAPLVANAVAAPEGGDAEDMNEDSDVTIDSDDEEEVNEDALALAAKRASFIAALNICGITHANLIRYLTEVQLLLTIDDFASLSLKEIGDMITTINKAPPGAGARRSNLVITAVAAKRLKGLREWVKWQLACGKVLDARDFTPVWMKWSVDRIDYESRLEIADETIAPKPEVLKNVGFKAWTPWWRQMTNYCGTVRGTLNVPIAYILRDETDPAPNILSRSYDSTDEALMACLSLTGEYYQLDNAKIWDIVEACTNQHHAWPFIKQLRKKKDGRAAIQILRLQAEGPASTATRKMIAYKLLDTIKYDGKGRFTFDQYIEKLQLGFCELAECGDPQSESHQIHILITNCHAATMKPGIDTVANDEDKYDTFMKACAFLQGYCARNASITSSDRRNISSVQADYSDLKESYPRDEWAALPKETKDRVLQRNRERKKKSGGKAKSTPLNKAKRKIKALQSKLKQKTVTPDEDSDTDSDVNVEQKTTKVKSTSTKPPPTKKA